MRTILLSLTATLVALAAGPAFADDDDDRYKEYRKRLKEHHKRESKFYKEQRKRYEEGIREQHKRDAEFYREQQKHYQELLRERDKWQREHFKKGKYRFGDEGYYPGPGYFPPQGPPAYPGSGYPPRDDWRYAPFRQPSYGYPERRFELRFFYPIPCHPYPARGWDDDDDDDDD